MLRAIREITSDSSPTSILAGTPSTRWAFLLVGLATLNQASGQEFSSEQLAFFERTIRPLLIDRCWECHGEESQEGGLRLDSRAAALRGGDHGPAVIAGNASKSLLVRAISYESEDLAMPPDGKLNPDQIKALLRWIEQKAAWTPEGEKQSANATRLDFRGHWAFQPIGKPGLPRVHDTSWPSNAIDHFILAKLEQAGLRPSPRAAAATLLRRAYLDLLGLPPNMEDVESFQKDRCTPEAFARLVEQLLSTREYGERWGRHWLDVARYADTKGYVDGGQVRFAFAYTYRDYVVRAFNEDLPFDQFVIDQLAADQNKYEPDQKWRLAGMGFLTVGRRFNHNDHDILDDRIDVISRGLQGLTVSCARCHDHKYDPIPTADYYSLYGILASSYEPHHTDLPLTEDDTNDASQSDYLTELNKRAVAYETEFRELHELIQHELRAFAGDYLVYLVQESPKHRLDSQNPLKTDRVVLRGPSAYGYGAIRRWRNFLAKRSEDDPVFGLWQRMDAVAKESFASSLRQELENGHHNATLKESLRIARPQNMVELARAFGDVLERVYKIWQERIETHPHSQCLEDEADEQLRQVLFGPESPASMNRTESIDCYHLDEHTKMRNLAGKVEELSIKTETALSRAMILRQRAEPHQPVVFLRGQPDREGQPVLRQLPAVFSAINDQTSEFQRPDGQDRVGLAEAIVSRQNPLTARVIVNRVWHWHFGHPLVATVSDFGTRGAVPSHPELLDFLSHWFMDNGWSLKQLHRLIVNSSTYQQASHYRPACAAVDPENKLLWRFNARRLEWEVIRDSLLAVSGRLQPGGSGRAIEGQPDDPDGRCRTLYLHIDRQDISPAARYFDFASPDFTGPQRPITTVPQQQLFFLNSPFVARQAESLGQRVARLDLADVERFQWLHRCVFARPSDLSDHEIRKWLSQLGVEGQTGRSGWGTVAHALLQSNAFIVIE